MKKSVITLVAILSFFTTLTAQKIYIKKIIDPMEDAPFYLLSSDMVVSNLAKTKGARLDAFVSEKNGGVAISDIAVKMINIGSNCVENNELVILFEDTTKITLVSWNKFNCDGDAWFHVSEDEVLKLSTLKIKKIKIINGSTYDSFTSDVKPLDADYYIQVYKAAKNGTIKEIKK